MKKLVIFGTVAAVGLAAGLLAWALGGGSKDVVVPHSGLIDRLSRGLTRQEQLVPEGHAGPFTLTYANSYFGRNDSLLTLRSDQSVELIASPQDRVVATPDEAIGRFRTKIPGALLAQIASAPAGSKGGGDGVLDRPTAFVDVHLAGASRSLVPSPALASLLADATRAALAHPISAIRLDVRRGPDCAFFAIENVGTEPVAFANPLLRPTGTSTGLFTMVAPPARPGVTQGPPDRKPLGFEPATDDVPELVQLKPGQRHELRSVPWQSTDPNEKVGGQWQDEGASEQMGGVFRVRGFLLSSLH